MGLVSCLAIAPSAGSSARIGAAFYGEARSSVIVTNGSMVLANIAATGPGGAIYCANCKEVTMQLGSTVAYNTASQGGACYCQGCELFQMQDVHLLHNR